jgi:hypothetical protein
VNFKQYQFALTHILRIPVWNYAIVLIISGHI